MDEGSSVLTRVGDGGHDCLDLPPGFRFHPTDEELVSHYLFRKVLEPSFRARAIGEVDLNKCEPWDLPCKANMGEKESYFFCMRDRKYPTGKRTNRATEKGYWKATGKDKEVYKGRTPTLVGMKKTLVFYSGRAPKGHKSNWVMHEYRLEGKLAYYNLPKATKVLSLSLPVYDPQNYVQNEWLVCRIFQKSHGIKKTLESEMPARIMNSLDDESDSSSLPPLLEYPADYMEYDFKPIRPSDRSLLPAANLPGVNYQQGNQKRFESHPLLNYPENPILMASGGPQFYSKTSLPSNRDYNLQPIANFTNLRQQSMQSFEDQLIFPQAAGLDPSGHAISRTVEDINYQKDLSRVCKVEQKAAGGSSVDVLQDATLSQETGFTSTDITTEISSILSRNELVGRSGYNDGEARSSSAGPVDIECLWNY